MELDTKQRELCNEIEKDFGRCEELWNQQYACVEKGGTNFARIKRLNRCSSN